MLVDFYDLIRFTLSFVVALFVPGYAWTFVLFDKITKLERLTYSFAFSIVLFPTSIFWLNFLGAGITPATCVATLLLLTLVALILWKLKKRILKVLGELAKILEKLVHKWL